MIFYKNSQAFKLLLRRYIEVWVENFERNIVRSKFSKLLNSRIVTYSFGGRGFKEAGVTPSLGIEIMLGGIVTNYGYPNFILNLT